MTRIQIFEQYELLVFSDQDVSLLKKLTTTDFQGNLDIDDFASIIFDRAWVTGDNRAILLLEIAIGELDNYSKRKLMRNYRSIDSNIKGR